MCSIWQPLPMRPTEILRRRFAFLRQAIVANPHDINLYLDFANVSIDHQSFQVGVDMINAGLRAEPNRGPVVCGARRPLRATCAIR